jgi:hypothetical protein
MQVKNGEKEYAKGVTAKGSGNQLFCFEGTLDVVEDLSWMEFSSDEIEEASSTVQVIGTPADGTTTYETSPTDDDDESRENKMAFETEAQATV